MGISIEQLVEHYPRLYHMAELNAHESILKHGLLSTSAILDLVSIADEERFQFESTPRKESLSLDHGDGSIFLIRDQKPLSASKLEGCFKDDLTVTEWCAQLNRKVYFWLERSKVEKLLEAKAYRDRGHMVLEVDTIALATAYQNQVTLAPMNTGSTSPMAHPRGRDTISNLDDYPYEDRRSRKLTIAVEFCIDYSVPDIYDYVVTIWKASAGTDWQAI